MNSDAAEIVFDRVTKTYAGRDAAALHELSLEIPAGTFCVLVGPSGGGKTTALKMVNRLIPFDSGDIRIDGRSVTSLPLTELRRGIGYVIQQIGLFPHMTVGANIATVPRLLGWPRSRIAERTAELLALVGLHEDDAERYPRELSGGQRQRVGLARALAAEPPVLLMDEPFGALDPINRVRLQTELRKLHRDVGRTIIFVTHDIDEAIQMGDRIAILREGGMLAQYDTPDAILARPADAFVAEFIGEDRALRRLALRTLARGRAAAVDGRRAGAPRVAGDDAAERRQPHAGDRERLGGRHRRGDRARQLPARRRGSAPLRLAGGPVIPSFGRGSSCVRGDHTFCWDWVRSHWHDTLGPALVQHVELTLIAVGIGFALAFPLALLAHRFRPLEHPIGALSALLYTIPSLALFQLLVPFTGLTWTTVEIALVAYTLVILFPNIVAGLHAAPPDVLEAARGMGLTRRQVLLRVELPLAVPAIVGGLRIAVVSTVAIATIAAFLLPDGPRLPDLPRPQGADAVQDRDLLGRRPRGRARARLRRPARRPPAPARPLGGAGVGVSRRLDGGTHDAEAWAA